MNSLTYHESPLGLLEIECSHQGILAIRFATERQTDVTTPSTFAVDCIKQLDEYFAGFRESFDLPLDFSGSTSFYREVWKLVGSIPYGRTRSYSDIAVNLGRPRACRAVGQANGHNPIPIVIPCHRVIGKKGKLTGYAYGIDVKQALLQIENPKTYSRQSALFA